MKKILPILVCALLATLCAAQSPSTAPEWVGTQLSIVGYPTPQVASASAWRSAGNPGLRTLYYWIVANGTTESSTPAGPFAVPNAPDALSSTAKVTVSWQPGSAANSYDVLRTSTNQPPAANCNCAVATGVTSASVTDQSETLQSYTISTGTKTVFSLVNEPYAAGVRSLRVRFQGTAIFDFRSDGGFGVTAVNGVYGTALAAGADLGAKVAWVYANICPTSGCTIDASDAAGNQSWGSTLNVSAKPLTLKLGHSTITSSVKPAIQVSGTWAQKSFFNLLGQGNSTLFKLSNMATGSGTGLIAIGDGAAYNNNWGEVANLQFDCGGLHCIDVNQYTNGVFRNLLFANYNDRALKLLHAWDTLIIGGNFNAGASGAWAGLTLNDASNTQVSGTAFYASRTNGVIGVEFEGTPSNNVTIENPDCGDDYVCVEAPKLAVGPITNLTIRNPFIENNASPFWIGKNGTGSNPQNVLFDGGQVSSSPSSGSFQIDNVTGLTVRRMNLQTGTFGSGVSALILEGNTYAGSKTNSATSYVDLDDPANPKFSGTATANKLALTDSSCTSGSLVKGDGTGCTSASSTDQWFTTSSGLTSTGDQNVTCATFSFSPSQPDTAYKPICSCNTTANNSENHFAGIVGIKNKTISSIDICIGASGSSGGTCTNFDCHLHHN